MDELGTGVITKITDGRFDNQYEVEITLMDGTKLSAFDGVSVYEKKKDGSEAKVWPLVQESKFQKKPFTWQGNVRETETKAGPKRYATISWANPVDDNAWTNGEGGENSGWGVPAEQANSAYPPATTTSGEVSRDTPSTTSYVNRDDTTRQIEAAWALGVLLPLIGNNQEALHREAHKLIVLKHQIAAELADG